MARIVQQGQKRSAYVTEFIADTIASLGEISKDEYAAGSEAYVIENGTYYVLGEDEQWHKKNVSPGSGSGGGSGANGEDGATFTPSVSTDGIISWTNDKLLPNPAPVNIKGKDGVTPHIDSATNNWFIGTTDTGVSATGGEYLIFKTHHSFPNIGKDNCLYIATDEDVIYRWNKEKSIYKPLIPEVLQDFVNGDLIFNAEVF